MNICLSKALNFYKSNTKQILKEKYFEGFGGDIKGFIVYNEKEKIEKYFIEINHIKVLICGIPMIGSKVLNAKNIFSLYMRNGLNLMAKNVDGNFSLIIIDEKKISINIIRDKIGLSPVYYTINSGFTCSSNAGAIAKSFSKNIVTIKR